MKVKRKYRLVSGCLVVALGCMCGLSACGEPSASYMPSNGGFESTNALDSTSSSSVSNDSSSKNSSKNVSLKDIAKKCNFKFWRLESLGSHSSNSAPDSLTIGEDQDSSSERETFKRDYACAIKNANPGDPIAEKFSDKIAFSDISSFFSADTDGYTKYMPPYLSSAYYIYSTYSEIDIDKVK
ncbi:hypothetical protein [Gardnerella sp. DNF00983]|uniref:hypothetical protein n=1 Tax=Gardnerella sp. DNF00983 TaxID=2749056 RepID=UPI003BAAC358